MALQLVHITDKGATRPSNQDSFCARISNFGRETIAMLAVCDGVGGLQSGELASTGAVRCFEEWFEQQLPEIVQSGLTADAVFFSWHRMLETLHTALCSYSVKTGIQLGTTVSALLLTMDGPISMATDLYAVGATLYYAVTGHAPEKSLGEVTPLEHYRPKISRSMQTIIVRAMQKQQTRRFQQASEMLRALKNIDQMDLGYKKCQFRKRVTAVVLAACFAASAYSCYYGVERMRSERENVYLLNLAQADQAEQDLEYDTARELLDSAIQQQPGRADAYLQMAAWCAVSCVGDRQFL